LVGRKHRASSGVPGRHELDETQELNFHFIAQAIADLDFQGYLTHEWGASTGKDPFEMLKKSIAIMKV
jgi:hydroxypyruvate isomerase